MLRKVLFSLALGLATSCAYAQTAPSPADVGISKGPPTDTFQLQDSTKTWVPFGTVDPSTHTFTGTGGAGSINTPPAGTTAINGGCPNGQFLYNNAGSVDCVGVAGGGATGTLTLYPTHALLASGVTAPSGSSATVIQQGFYAAGDGGQATYNWNAASYCPDGTSSAPKAADGITCIIPTGQSPSVAGRYLIQTNGSVDARQVGMQPGGQDNSPFVPALMNAVGNFPGLPAASEIVFSSTVPRATTTYYFSQPFVMSRNAKLNCKGVSMNSAGPVVLLFPPGVDGVIQEGAQWADDNGYGQSDIEGCTIMSLGEGDANAGYITYPTPAVVTGGSGYVGTSGTMTYAGYECQPNSDNPTATPPVYHVTASGGIITTVSSVTTPGKCRYGIPVGATNWTPSAGLSGGSGVSFNLDTVNQVTVANTNAATEVQLQNFMAPNDPHFTMPSSCAPRNGSCTIGVGDGLAMIPSWLPIGGQMAVDPGAYVSASDPVARTFTLASPYTFLPNRMRLGGGVAIYDLPAAQKYTVVTSGTDTGGGSGQITILSGPAGVNGGMRVLKPGDVVWSDAFLFGTSVQSIDGNSIAGAVTVRSGGSGYTGTAGTMTWSGGGCGYGVAPVLNVTAAGGIITGVSSVANAGDCHASSPSSTATTWTPGGGLSGGSGASFNMTFHEIVTMANISEQPSVAVLAHKTHATGSPGQLWEIPVGIHRRTGGVTHHDTVQYFGFGLKLTCGGAPATGCNGAYDERDTLSYSLVGRLVLGDNSGVSTEIGMVGANNFISDIVEAGSIGSVYISDQLVSEDNGSSIYGALVLCGSQNYSVFIGTYLAGQGRFDAGGYMKACMGNDSDGNAAIGVEASDGQGSVFWLAPTYGGPPPAMGAGGLLGNMRFAGRSAFIFTTTATSAAGQKIVNLTTGTNVVAAGQYIVDLTHPVIPANYTTDIPTATTTITEVGQSSLQISSNITGAGIQVGDKIQISQYAPDFYINPGMVADGANGLAFGDDQNGPQFALYHNGYLNSWDLGTGGLGGGMMRMAATNYLGYPFAGGNDIVFPNGLELGNHQEPSGSERELDIGPVPPTTETYHLQGNIRFNSTPVPGDNFAWTDTEVFRTTSSAAITAGTTTSFAVAACPSPAAPAGTVVIDYTGKLGAVNGLDVQQPIGNLATCTTTTLTLQAAALNSVPSGHQISLLGWRPAGPIAADVGGVVYRLGTPVAIASLPACGAATIGYAVVNNGVAAPTYNAAVSTTGPSVRPVFCDGSGWTYH